MAAMPKDERRGYDKHMFVQKEIVLQYKCEKCHEVLNDPVQIGSCGHQFCGVCLAEDVKECPECGEDVQPNGIFRDNAAKRKILALEIKCQKCRWKGKLKELIEEHNNQCAGNRVKCSNEGCHAYVKRNSLQRHLNNECKFREIACEYCQEKLAFNDQQAHEDENCARIPVDCPNQCQEKIPREEVDHHKKEECGKTLIDCSFKGVGCEDEIERAQIHEHEETMVRQHLLQSAQVITNLEREKETMTEEIQQLKEINDRLIEEIGGLHETEETRANAIHSEFNEFKREGEIQLESLKRTTEQNFENLSLVVEQNTVFHETLLHTRSSQATLEEQIIPDLYAKSLSNKAGNIKLAENETKLEKMIVVLYNKLSKEILNLEEKMGSKIDELCEKQEMDRTALEKHEAKNEEDMANLREEISENRKQRLRVKEELRVTQDEMTETFSNQCKQIQLSYDSLNDTITKETQSRKNDYIQLSEEISELYSFINNGILIWRISNVYSSLAKTATEPLIGQTFYSDTCGYALQPKIFFNGSRKKDHGHVAIFIQILKGKFDAILKWPFAKRIRFTLIEQGSMGDRGGIEMILIGAEIRRPSDDTNNGFGIYKFVSHEVLRAGRYIVNDVMFVKIEVLDVEENKQSETL